MGQSSTENPDAGAVALPDGPDRLSVKRWLAVYAVYMLALLVPAAILLGRMGSSWREFFGDPAGVTRDADAALKLLLFGAYISVCCTFLPLPANAMVSAVSIQEFAPYPDSILATTALVATVGAWASMMANLLDFHLFTVMLRSRRVARIRHTRLYQRSARWFARQPFAILVIFNILPIPIDVVRMLAATYRYGLGRFAAANFIGRWVRYAVLAAVTFSLGKQGWVAVVALLAVAAVLAAPRLLRRWLDRRRRTGVGAADGGTM